MAAPKGAQIPREGLAQAERIVQKMWEAVRRAPASKDALAGHLGHKNANSGPFRVKLGLLRHFGLVEARQDDQLQVSEIGRDILVPERRQEARRKAFLSQTYYKSLIENYVDHELPSEESVKTTLHYDYQLPESSAEDAAAAFLESARLAGLVDANGRVRLVETDGDVDSNGDLKDTGLSGDLKKRSGEAPSVGDRALKGIPDETPEAQVRTFGQATPSVQVQLDLSGLDADAIIRVLEAMGLARRGKDE